MFLPVRRLRSLLGVLATDGAGMESATSAGADAVVIDLEDGVAAAEKDEARHAAREFIEKHGATATIFVRINARTSRYFAEDVAALVIPGLAGVQFPKACHSHDIGSLDDALAAAEASAGLPVGQTRIIPTLESALAVRNAHAVAAASRRIVGVMPAIGENGDLQQDMGYSTTPDEIGSRHARWHIVLAARAVGVDAIDGVYMRVDDEAGFVRSVRLARSLGYRAKKVAHASQVDTVNEVFG
jgi:citrate lyase subunit beta / citryl-CoA lyase